MVFPMTVQVSSDAPDRVPVLELRGVSVAVGDVVVCQDVDLVLPAGELHILFGPNGSGKSSLLAAILGIPPYQIVSGEVLFRGEPINELDIEQRARLGIGIAFQRPPALSGVTMRQFAAAIGAGAELDRAAESLDLAGFGDRGVNTGFSGGEIKRWELLKLVLQRPELALFDEPESGVDLEHIAAVGAAIDRIVNEPAGSGNQVAALAITHTGYVLDYVAAQRGHLMIEGRVVDSGDPVELFNRIKQHGYRVPADV